MGRKCSVVGCHSSVGLHLFPKNLEIRRQWLRAIGLGEDCKLPPHAGVCKLHFARNAFANSMEVEMGYASLFRLKSESVPTLALPRLSLSPPTLLPRQQDCFGRQSEPVTREIGCQTDPVIVRHASVQANVKPSRRSKAIQARSAYTSVSCGTGDLMEIPLPDSPRAASTPLKRKRCEVPASDPSSHMNCSSLPGEVPPHKDKKYIVHEDFTVYIVKLMAQLFENVVVDPVLYQEHSEKVPVPEPLCAQYEKPHKQEAVSRHRSRFFNKT